MPPPNILFNDFIRLIDQIPCFYCDSQEFFVTHISECTLAAWVYTQRSILGLFSYPQTRRHCYIQLLLEIIPNAISESHILWSGTIILFALYWLYIFTAISIAL